MQEERDKDARNGEAKRSLISLLGICNFQDTLSQVLAFKHAQKPLDGVVHTVSDVVDALQTSFSDPLGHILVSLLSMRHDVCVKDEKSFPSDPSSHELRVVLDPLVLPWLIVVSRDAPTSNFDEISACDLVSFDGKQLTNSSMLFHVIQSNIKELTTNIVVIYIKPFRSKPLDRLCHILFLVIKSR